MQIEADQSVCPACGAEGLQVFPVLHHMMCAYVGPQYDAARQPPDMSVRNVGAKLYQETPLAKSWGWM